ncbi:MAG: hypothetical protein ACRDI2_00180 [Chloroflexota bacterium]
MRLAEVMAWCLPRVSTADPAKCLRSPALRPTIFGDQEAPPAQAYDWVTSFENQRVMNALAEERAAHLRREDRYPVAPAEDLAGGRLLLPSPQGSVWDGASEAESHGFIDIDDAPPWDTWIGILADPNASAPLYAQSIVNWVPPDYVAAVDAAIRVNPVENLAWATELEALFTPALKTARVT